MILHVYIPESSLLLNKSLPSIKQRNENLFPDTQLSGGKTREEKSWS